VKNLFTVVLVLAFLLSIGASAPKLLQASQEVAFFVSVGLPVKAVLLFGVVQLAGGILLVFKPTRVWGAAATGIMFLASAIMVFLSGKTVFGLVSLLPVLLASFVLKGSVSGAAESND